MFKTNTSKQHDKPTDVDRHKSNQAHASILVFCSCHSVSTRNTGNAKGPWKRRHGELSRCIVCMSKWNPTNTTAQSDFFHLQQITKHYDTDGPCAQILPTFLPSVCPVLLFLPCNSKTSQRIGHVFDQVAICLANFCLLNPICQVMSCAFRRVLHFQQNQQTTTNYIHECLPMKAAPTKNPMAPFRKHTVRNEPKTCKNGTKIRQTTLIEHSKHKPIQTSTN